MFPTQNWIGEKIAYWCRNESLGFRQKEKGPVEKYLWAECQQEGGLPPWWTIKKIPECVNKDGKIISLW